MNFTTTTTRVRRSQSPPLTLKSAGETQCDQFLWFRLTICCGALDEVAKSPALVLILTGAGKAFCSGMDLENLKSLIGRSPAQNVKDSETMVRLFRTLRIS